MLSSNRLIESSASTVWICTGSPVWQMRDQPSMTGDRILATPDHIDHWAKCRRRYSPNELPDIGLVIQRAWLKFRDTVTVFSIADPHRTQPGGNLRPPAVIARSAATKQSLKEYAVSGDCFAALAMTPKGTERSPSFGPSTTVQGRFLSPNVNIRASALWNFFRFCRFHLWRINYL